MLGAVLSAWERLLRGTAPAGWEGACAAEVLTRGGGTWHSRQERRERETKARGLEGWRDALSWPLERTPRSVRTVPITIHRAPWEGRDVQAGGRRSRDPIDRIEDIDARSVGRHLIAVYWLPSRKHSSPIAASCVRVRTGLCTVYIAYPCDGEAFVGRAPRF